LKSDGGSESRVDLAGKTGSNHIVPGIEEAAISATLASIP